MFLEHFCLEGEHNAIDRVMKLQGTLFSKDSGTKEPLKAQRVRLFEVLAHMSNKWTFKHGSESINMSCPPQLVATKTASYLAPQLAMQRLKALGKAWAFQPATARRSLSRYSFSRSEPGTGRVKPRGEEDSLQNLGFSCFFYRFELSSFFSFLNSILDRKEPKKDCICQRLLPEGLVWQREGLVLEGAWGS